MGELPEGQQVLPENSSVSTIILFSTQLEGYKLLEIPKIWFVSILVQAPHPFPITPGQFQQTSPEPLWSDAQQTLCLRLGKPST